MVTKYGEDSDPFHLIENKLSIFLALNPNFPPLDDPRVREALRLAVDHTAVCEKVIVRTCAPLYGLIPDGMQGYRSPVAATPLDARLERARQLMEAAGFSDENRAQIRISATRSGANPVFLGLVASGWRTIHVDPIIDDSETDYSVWRETFYSGQLPVALRIYSENSLEQLLLVCANRSYNCGQYDDPIYFDLVNRALREPDSERRMQMIQQAEARLIGDSRIVPLVARASGAVMKETIDTTRSRFMLPLNLTRIYLTTDGG